MKILISGGAGFVGSGLAGSFRQHDPKAKIVVLDNLKRRGSELKLPILKARNIEFHHGDIRMLSDLTDLEGQFDLFIEASAEPSVLAGMNGNPSYAIQTNLNGTQNCLEFARSRCDKMVFLSTSRVYSIPALLELPLEKSKTRFVLKNSEGIDENFSTQGFRSIYGTTKLASEMLIEEYAHAYGLKAVINRCGVLAGPWQMGKVDQGVFTLWMARHVFGGKLNYTGFEGTGFQVRDLLHPTDLFNLILKQLDGHQWKADIFNVGGGLSHSVSLYELTQLCREISGRSIEIGLTPATSPVDIPFYVSDCRRAKAAFGWEPKISIKELMTEIHQWLVAHEKDLRPLFT